MALIPPLGDWQVVSTNEREYQVSDETVEVPVAFEQMKQKVTEILVAEYDLLIEEAETVVEESATNKPELWFADPNDLAKFLASDDDDD